MMAKPLRKIPKVLRLLCGLDGTEALAVLLACTKMLLDMHGDEATELHKLIVAYLKPSRRKGKKVKHLRVIKGGKR